MCYTVRKAVTVTSLKQSNKYYIGYFGYKKEKKDNAKIKMVKTGLWIKISEPLTVLKFVTSSSVKGILEMCEIKIEIL